MWTRANRRRGRAGSVMLYAMIVGAVALGLGITTTTMLVNRDNATASLRTRVGTDLIYSRLEAQLVNRAAILQSAMHDTTPDAGLKKCALGAVADGCSSAALYPVVIYPPSVSTFSPATAATGGGNSANSGALYTLSGVRCPSNVTSPTPLCPIMARTWMKATCASGATCTTASRIRIFLEVERAPTSQVPLSPTAPVMATRRNFDPANPDGSVTGNVAVAALNGGAPDCPLSDNAEPPYNFLTAYDPANGTNTCKPPLYLAEQQNRLSCQPHQLMMGMDSMGRVSCGQVMVPASQTCPDVGARPDPGVVVGFATDGTLICGSFRCRDTATVCPAGLVQSNDASCSCVPPAQATPPPVAQNCSNVACPAGTTQSNDASCTCKANPCAPPAPPANPPGGGSCAQCITRSQTFTLTGPDYGCHDNTALKNQAFAYARTFGWDHITAHCEAQMEADVSAIFATPASYHQGADFEDQVFASTNKSCNTNTAGCGGTLHWKASYSSGYRVFCTEGQIQNQDGSFCAGNMKGWHTGPCKVTVTISEACDTPPQPSNPPAALGQAGLNLANNVLEAVSVDPCPVLQPVLTQVNAEVVMNEPTPPPPPIPAPTCTPVPRKVISWTGSSKPNECRAPDFYTRETALLGMQLALGGKASGECTTSMLNSVKTFFTSAQPEMDNLAINLARENHNTYKTLVQSKECAWKTDSALGTLHWQMSLNPGAWFCTPEDVAISKDRAQNGGQFQFDVEECMHAPAEGTWADCFSGLEVWGDCP